MLHWICGSLIITYCLWVDVVSRVVGKCASARNYSLFTSSIIDSNYTCQWTLMDYTSAMSIQWYLCGVSINLVPLLKELVRHYSSMAISSRPCKHSGFHDNGSSLIFCQCSDWLDVLHVQVHGVSHCRVCCKSCYHQFNTCTARMYVHFIVPMNLLKPRHVHVWRNCYNVNVVIHNVFYSCQCTDTCTCHVVVIPILFLWF